MRFFILILLLFLSGTSDAHQDLSRYYNRENIHIECTTGWDKYEYFSQAEILLDVTDSLFSALHLDKIPLKIILDQDYTQVDTNVTTASLQKFEYNYWKNDSLCVAQDSGIYIYSRSYHMDIVGLTHLVYRAVKERNEFPNQQKEHTVELKHYPIKVNSIPFGEVKKLMTKPSNAIKKLLNNRFYAPKKDEPFKNGVKYWFENGKYTLQFPFSSPKNRHQYLTVNSILELVGDNKLGYFVFINADEFLCNKRFHKRSNISERSINKVR